MIEYIKWSFDIDSSYDVQMWLLPERGWQWDPEKGTLDGRFNPDFYRERYIHERANTWQLRQFVRAVFEAKLIIGAD